MNATETLTVTLTRAQLELLSGPILQVYGDGADEWRKTRDEARATILAALDRKQ